MRSLGIWRGNPRPFNDRDESATHTLLFFLCTILYYRIWKADASRDTHFFLDFFLTLSGKKSPTSELSLDAFEICLHSGKSSAIIEPSGMVNEFQGCIARIPNLAKARFAGFVCCIHLQLSEKK